MAATRAVSPPGPAPGARVRGQIGARPVKARSFWVGWPPVGSALPGRTVLGTRHRHELVGHGPADCVLLVAELAAPPMAVARSQPWTSVEKVMMAMASPAGIGPSTVVSVSSQSVTPDQAEWERSMIRLVTSIGLVSQHVAAAEDFGLVGTGTAVDRGREGPRSIAACG